MGGQVLEHEGKTIYNAGIKEGIALGEARGIAVGEERGRREEKFETARRLRENDVHKATHISLDDFACSKTPYIHNNNSLLSCHGAF